MCCLRFGGVLAVESTRGDGAGYPYNFMRTLAKFYLKQFLIFSSQLKHKIVSLASLTPKLFTQLIFKMPATNGANGSKPGKPFPPGVHVPSLTWFRDTPEQEIDWEVQKYHFRFLIESGLHGSMYTLI